MRALNSSALTLAGVCMTASLVMASDAYDITIPAVPKQKIAIPDVPPVKIHYAEHNGSTSSAKAVEKTSYRSKSLDRGIGFSKRTPPDWAKQEAEPEATEAGVGNVKGGRVSLYLRGPFVEPGKVAAILKDAGFTLLSSTPLDKKQQLIAMVVTNDTLQKAAVKPARGFAASLRILVDRKNGKISIQNPLYALKAFLQEDYDEAAAAQTLEKVRSLFSGLEDSQDSVKYSVLPKYRFMDAMPYYQDMVEVGSGNNKALLDKVRASKKLLFEQHLGNGAVLVGVQLSPKTSKFVEMIGYHNAALLPYPLLIEDGKAKILDPKYYISVMYPQLSMSNFMSIAAVPGAIEKECRTLFR